MRNIAMLPFRLPSRWNTKELSYQLGILMISVFCIVYFLPRKKQSNYQFEEGRPWPYGQIMATFDFPIYKSDDVLKREKDSIMSQFTPYYTKDDSISKSLVQTLETRLRQNSPELPQSQMRKISETFRKLYQRPVMASEAFSRHRSDSVRTVCLYKGNDASRIPLLSIRSTKDVYQIMMSDSMGLDKGALQRCNLVDLLQPNLVYDEERSRLRRDELESSISVAKDIVFNGTKIVDRGEIVTPEIYEILLSWQKESLSRSGAGEEAGTIILGQVIFVALILACFMIFLNRFRRDYLDAMGKILLVFSLIVIFPVITALMVRHNILNVYVLPYAMVPMTVRVFMDSRTAFITNMVVILLSSITLRFPYEFMLLQLMAGWVAILTLNELSERAQLFRCALIVTVVSMLFYLGFDLIHEDDLTKLNLGVYQYLAVSGVLLLFTYPFLYMLEKMFKFTSDVTLVELSNINSPILKRLSEEAPGTFQHSLQVSNLAAEVAQRIGAKSQLVRTAALYHDIGKICNAVYFTENQKGVNPHDQLSPAESARVIIQHVTDGIRLAEENSLPQIIKDFITTHHGKGMAKYFYTIYRNMHPDEEIDKDPFTYPGPNPFTREQAILMMADSVEAASRSLASYTDETIGKLVESIVDSQVESGFFRRCPITFQDIETTKSVLKEKLKVIYHTRISYPTLNSPE